MKTPPATATPRLAEGLLPALFLATLATALAGPSLWEAWRHDPYARGGDFAFAAWLLSLGLAYHQSPHKQAPRPGAWIALAALCCVFGTLTSTRAFHHLALAISLAAATPAKRLLWLLLPAALTWLPASSQILSRVLSGGLCGWERPAAALVLAALPLSLRRGKPPACPLQP
jgi:hypothetical protein